MANKVILFVIVTVVLSFLTVDGAYPISCPTGYVEAACDLKTNPNMRDLPGQINGHVYFRQRVSQRCRRMGMLHTETEIRGIPTNDGTYKHGIHVHESSDTSNGCESMGLHFNPLGTPHGDPADTFDMRHVGDLGNVMNSATVFGGHVKESRDDYLLNLVGPNSIIGRGLVLHAKTDDLGLGGNDGSLRVGNSGSRLACCVIRELKRI